MSLYVSAVEGHLAPRYGTARSTPGKMVEHRIRKDQRPNAHHVLRVRQPGTVYNHEFFGVTRTETPVEKDGRKTVEVDLKWDTKAVFVITDADLARHPREFRQMLDDGALVEKTKAEYDAWLAARGKAEGEQAAKEKAAADAKAKAEKKAPETQPTA